MKLKKIEENTLISRNSQECDIKSKFSVQKNVKITMPQTKLEDYVTNIALICPDCKYLLLKKICLIMSL